MKFDMGEAWREATAMIAANREVMLIVAGIFFFLPSLLQTIALPDMGAMMFGISDPEQMEAALAGIFADYWWVFVLVLVLQLVGYLALLALLRDAAKPTVGEAIRAGFVGLLPAIGVTLIVAIAAGIVVTLIVGAAAASGVAALAFIAVMIVLVGMIYLYVKISLYLPIIAIDKAHNPFTVLATSWRLTKGNSFRLFLFYLLIAIVYMVLSMVIGLVVTALLVALGPEVGMVINGIVSGILGAALSIVFVAILASIHRQLAGPSDAAISETFE